MLTMLKPLIEELIQERARLDRAISVLQALDQKGSAVDTHVPEKRGRGRPRGSGNKVKQLAADHVQALDGHADGAHPSFFDYPMWPAESRTDSARPGRPSK